MLSQAYVIECIIRNGGKKREKLSLMMNTSMHKVQIKIKCGVFSDSRNYMWQMPKVGMARKKFLKELATVLSYESS